MQVVKVLKAIDILSKPEGATKKELAETLEVSGRQAYRIIKSIEDLGFPIYDEEVPLEKEKRWKFEESYVNKLPNITIPNIKLSISEIIALYLLRGDEKIYRGTDIEKKIGSAFNKIGMFLPDEAVDQLKKIKTLFVPAAKFTKDYSGKEETIEKLMDAILKTKSCFVVYHAFSSNTVSDYKIDPLHFFEREGGLYIFARTANHKNIITLAVERINQLVVSDDSFEYPKDFDPEELLDAAFDIVHEEPAHFKIRFSADQVRYVKERVWSKTQKIEEQEDGSIIFTMTTSGMWDVKRWVLTYGKHAEVLEPKELRQEIAEELKAAYTNYNK